MPARAQPPRRTAPAVVAQAPEPARGRELEPVQVPAPELEPEKAELAQAPGQELVQERVQAPELELEPEAAQERAVAAANVSC